MAIPLFDPNYLASPNAGGVVSNATVNLLVQQGQETTRRLEVSSLRNEAAAKAPIMAQLYETAYSQILQGNMGGFSHLAKADSLSAGNPFLSAMTQDASRAAANIAQSYLQTELQKASFAQQEKMQTERITGQKELQASGIKGQIEAGRSIEERQMRVAAANDYRDANIKIDQLEVADLAAWQKEVQIAQRKIELGEEGITIPPKPSKRPRPQPPTDIQGDLPRGQREVQGDVGLFNANDNVITQNPPQGLPVEGRAVDPTLAAIDEVLANEKKKTQIQGVVEDEAARTKIKIIEPPGTQPKTEQIKFGEMVFTIPIDKDELPKTEEVGKTRYQFKGKVSSGRRLMDALSRVKGADSTFTNWATAHMKLNNRVVIREEQDLNKKAVYQPYLVTSDDKEHPWKKEDGENKTVDKEVYENYKIIRPLMEKELKGRIGIKVPMTEESKAIVREGAIAKIEAKEIDIPSANRQLAFSDIKLITAQEIAERGTRSY